ncbi:MAG: cbb3-type cytochrome c oxidase subunit II, partial [Pseudomonadales bacterium]|nr:cbb3-type cytochrome c oxidase subunit II [Pseudomonadales bacterium]
SNMPSYPWLFDTPLDGSDTATKMRVLRTLGVPYTDADISGAGDAVAGFTEADALIAYLQSLGQDMRGYGGMR